MDEARHLLSKEASANPTSMSMYKILDDLMKKMPVPNVCMFFSCSSTGKRAKRDDSISPVYFISAVAPVTSQPVDH